MLTYSVKRGLAFEKRERAASGSPLPVCGPRFWWGLCVRGGWAALLRQGHGQVRQRWRGAERVRWHPAWPSLAGVGGALPRSGAFSGLSLTASPCEGPSCGDRSRSRGQNLPWEEAGPLCLPTLPCAHLGGGDLHSLRCSLFFRKSELPYPRDFLNSKEKPLTVGINN